MPGSFDDDDDDDEDDEDDWEDDEPEAVEAPPPPPYTGPRFGEGIDEEDVHAALEFLVAIEPPLGSVNTRAEYEAATISRRDEIKAFAEESQPADLATMRRDYFGFTNDARYTGSRKALAVVTGALNEAWHGVGLWRR